ncbi:interleukin-1 receptor-associated kinase 4 isoform X2 [Brienomyrus brachyistius]|uniref:interleukin-1 receptor-associated kinase 4 isoform X2 n=1 Tax=Brienomyrus brachyistius TaxID=42636 RepID=UPI0020B3F0AB|nr:interleukin-1 receptor-associated kinase 4 isoform X2 [Brienomyrus brachyistius]
MAKSITPSTFVRNLTYGKLCELSDFLDPQDNWKKVIVNIYKPTGEPRYTQNHLRRFEGLVASGKRPTVELLHDWGTTNCTVGDLVEILEKNNLLAAADILLPGREGSAEVTAPLGIVGHLQISQTSQEPVEDEEQPSGSGFRGFSFQELLQMTGNFDDRPALEGGSRLGEGGFGVVYRGCFNGANVAVKKLSCMGDISPQELKIQFKQEVQTLQMLKHKNILDMVGFSCDGDHPCLVCSYMCNGSLLDRLACLGGSSPLSWTRRCLITVGTARGLEYLHDNRHIHRDVKSGNILLDETFEAKLSDFGLTRNSSKHSSSTVLTEKIVGTTAYMAPEALRGEITPKSDIFSLGVVLLEVISGLPPADDSRQPQFLMEMKDEIEDEEMTLEDFVDKKMGPWDQTSVENMYSLSKKCLSERKNRRPQIKEVLTELENALTTLLLEQQSIE